MARTRPIRLDDYLPYLINRVGAALVERFSAAALTARGLSINEWRVLATLSNGGRQRQIDLAGMTTIDPSTLSRLIARMARNGLVTRARSKTSNREVDIQLTPKGRSLVQAIIPVALATERAAAKSLSADELAILKRALRRIHESLARKPPAPQRARKAAQAS